MPTVPVLVPKGGTKPCVNSASLQTANKCLRDTKQPDPFKKTVVDNLIALSTFTKPRPTPGTVQISMPPKPLSSEEIETQFTAVTENSAKLLTALNRFSAKNKDRLIAIVAACEIGLEQVKSIQLYLQQTNATHNKCFVYCFVVDKTMDGYTTVPQIADAYRPAFATVHENNDSEQAPAIFCVTSHLSPNDKNKVRSAFQSLITGLPAKHAQTEPFEFWTSSQTTIMSYLTMFHYSQINQTQTQTSPSACHSNIFYMYQLLVLAFMDPFEYALSTTTLRSTNTNTNAHNDNNNNNNNNNTPAGPYRLMTHISGDGPPEQRMN
jgi:hypothetical protein